MNYVLLRGARQLVTLAGPPGYRRGTAMRELQIISDGAMLIRDGVIEQVGPSRRLDHVAAARQADEIDATGRIVLPAFVDCYAHLFTGPPRWEERTGMEALAASLRVLQSWSPQRLDLEGRRRTRQFVRFGTALLGAGCGFGCDEEADLRAIRAMDRLATPLLELLPFLHTRLAALTALNIEPDGHALLGRLATGLLSVAGIRKLLHGVALDEGFTEDAMTGYLACAGRLGLARFVEAAGLAQFEQACRAGATAVVGLEGVRRVDAPGVANAPAAAILAPARSFQSGGPYAEGRALIDAGAAVALASAFDPLSSGTASMSAVLALATRQLGMTAEEALVCATVNGAEMLGMGARAGRLESGMPADFIIADCQDYREIPLYLGANPVASLVRGGQSMFPRLAQT